MFDKLLIANRGEIACRIVRTAKKMGLATVAVYSTADRDALHVQLADEAVEIGPPAPRESYLSLERIVEACRRTGAQAVHPGYGFLSENPRLALALAEADIVFIGPPPEAISVMGDKIAAKQLAHRAGVAIVPGHDQALTDAAQAVQLAGQLGYPVMLKASAGGGGKGMRIAFHDEECRLGFEAAAREAESSFGDGRVFLEKFIQEPRHIEFQILADRYGHVIHLGERECSLQRRHQKVIEESPSPLLDGPLRAAMGEQAVALARAVQYESAGTVEFIVDAGRQFYFLEMNTRLQVEHPVTEFVTGLDLVELMIRIAAGEPLPIRQSDVELNGWALEARVYAEDPFRGFLPSVGRLVRFLPPRLSDVVRVDTGVREGSEVSIHYDPMIAKVITSGATRERAITHMRDALNEFYIRGVAHNISFLAALIEHTRFREARLTTHLIAEEYPHGFHPGDAVHDDPVLLICVAAAIHRRYRERAARISGQMPGYEPRVGTDWVVVMNQQHFPVTIVPTPNGHQVTLSGEHYEVRSEWTFGNPIFRGTINEDPVCLQVERRDLTYRLFHWGCQIDVIVLTARAAELLACMPEKPPPDMSRYLLSPMPGLLSQLHVGPGDNIQAGQLLAVVEAMKMENSLRSERDGTVHRLLAEVGDTLAVDQPILEFA